MFESIPVEMRGISVISLVLFSFGSIITVFFYKRISRLEEVVTKRCTDIERLNEMTENLEDLMKSVKVDNQQMIEWVREDIRTNGDRIEASLSELRTRSG